MGAALSNDQTGDHRTASWAAFTVTAKNFQFVPVATPITGNGLKGCCTGSQGGAQIAQSSTENFADGAVKPAGFGFGHFFR